MARPAKNTNTVATAATLTEDAASNIAATTTSKEQEDTNNSVEYKEFAPEELIQCRSVTQGELLLPGAKSRILYRWYKIGDITEVEYQDLYALNARHSKYLFEPHFVIENEELLAHPRWKALKDIYDNMYNAEDMNEIFRLSPAQLKSILKKIPKSYARALSIEIATRINNGTFDSISRIKAFDEILGTDLLCLIK